MTIPRPASTRHRSSGDDRPGTSWFISHHNRHYDHPGQGIPVGGPGDPLPTARELARYAGRYYGPELQSTFTLAVEDGKLVARHPHLGDVILTPSRNGTLGFAGDRWYLRTATFEKERDGTIRAMLATAGRVGGLRFERQR